MKDLSELTKDTSDTSKFVLLFGKGNNYEAIKKYSEQNNLINFITVGIIADSTNSLENDYKVFNFEIDPRLIIYNKEGEIKLLEDMKNRNKINLDFLKKWLK